MTQAPGIRHVRCRPIISGTRRTFDDSHIPNRLQPAHALGARRRSRSLHTFRCARNHAVEILEVRNLNYKAEASSARSQLDLLTKPTASDSANASAGIACNSRTRKQRRRSFVPARETPSLAGLTGALSVDAGYAARYASLLGLVHGGRHSTFTLPAPARALAK